jgi:hypothetical protein
LFDIAGMSSFADLLFNEPEWEGKECESPDISLGW